ncbi:HAD-IA family hydrolase [Nocardia jiangsuensis]|uniref:HAD-IA family hydrolase n=1 Tax=Nocardia jiangsuensis TaxID=1691563 RepID=A0ABV8DPI5_9NOCA
MDNTTIDSVRHRAVLIELRNLITAKGTANRTTLMLVERLREAAIPIGVYSAGRPTRAALTAAGIEKNFTAFIDPATVRDLDLPAPPAPDLLHEAARNLGALPQRTVVIDDTETGVAAARAGGFALVIGIDHQGAAEPLHRAGADLVVADAEAIVLAGRTPYPVSVGKGTAYTELRLTRTVPVDRIPAAVVEGVRAIFALATRAGLDIVGSPSATIDSEPDEDAVTLEFGLPIIHPETPVPGTRIVTTEPGLVARTFHTGSVGNLGPAYRALELWLAESNYRTVGPRTETYLVGPGDESTLDELTIEIQIPVVYEAMITADRPQRPAEVTGQLVRWLPEHGFELLTITSSASESAIAERTLLLVRHRRLAEAACAADEAHAAALLTSTVSVRAGTGGGSVVEVLDPAVLVTTLRAPALNATADRLRYLLAATVATLHTAPYSGRGARYGPGGSHVDVPQAS